MSKKNFIKKHIKKSKKASMEPDLENLNSEQFIRVLNWYSASDFTENNRKNWVIEYAEANQMECKSLKKINESHFFPTFTTLCHLSNRGLDVSEYDDYILHNFDKLKEYKASKPKDKSDRPTVQDRIFEQSRCVLAEIDYFIDCKILNNEEKPLTDLLIVKNFSALHTKHLLDFIQVYVDEYESVGKGTEALNEIGMSKKQLKSMLVYLETLKIECLKWQISKKKLRKPHEKKIKKPSELCKNVVVADASILPPEKIIKSSFTLIYNVKYNKLLFFVSDKITGLSIKGKTIINYDEKKSKVYKIKKEFINSFIKKLSLTTGINSVKTLLKDKLVFTEANSKITGRLSENINIVRTN